MGSSELPPARTEAHRKDFSEGGKVLREKATAPPTDSILSGRKKGTGLRTQTVPIVTLVEPTQIRLVHSNNIAEK